MLNIIKTPFINTKSSFKHSNISSRLFNLNKGVRQTNSLKSTLFNIFINDLRPLFVQEKWTPVEVIWCRWFKKSLRIPKGQSESVYRRTDNTMAKRKSANGQTTIYKI